jgi:hypothetical protein
VWPEIGGGLNGCRVSGVDCDVLSGVDIETILDMGDGQDEAVCRSRWRTQGSDGARFAATARPAAG